MNWHKIDWKKFDEIFDPISHLSTSDGSFWDYLVEKGLQLDSDGYMVGEWEDFLGANFPMKDDEYLLYFGDDYYSIGYYDGEEIPGFTSEERPSHWCELVKP